jgi:lytic cellulose monooxygenase (C1-hydroxylating)
MAMLSALLAALAFAAGTRAHGHVTHIIINGTQYQGFDPTTFPYMANPPVVVGWTADQLDNGFVAPAAYASADMICHRAAKPAGGHAQVRAGDVVTLQWSTWPESHKGPVVDWLAPCGGPCEAVDKAALRFFKIDGAGMVSAGAPGRYAADVLIEKGNTWSVRIPPNVKPGNYVLRHEIIALHGAGSAGGAQSYPQCFNLEVTGAGTDSFAGVAGTALYSASDPGVLVNIYDASLQYQVPGGAVVAGGVSSVAQNPSTAVRTASATLPGGGGGVTTSTTITTTRATTTGVTTTPAATTTTTRATTTTSSSGAGQTLYGQCGGIGWTGPTSCAQGTCTKLNDYYSQCV